MPFGGVTVPGHRRLLGRPVAVRATLVVVDAITAVGAFRFETEAWGLDAVICGSQKALSLPPGLAFVSLSQRAKEAMGKARRWQG